MSPQRAIVPPQKAASQDRAFNVKLFLDSTGLVSSIKGEVKKKHLSDGWNFSCFAAHLIERGLF